MEKKVQYNNAKTWQVILFGFSDPATNAVFLIFMGQFLLYATSVYGLNAALVGVIMAGTRLLDAVTDPIIGLMVDKTDTKIGKFRPWILMGSTIINISFIIIFSGIDLGSKTMNAIFLTFFYCIFIIGYTFQCTVTKSGQTVLTNNPKQRTLFNSVAQLVTFALYIVLITIIVPFMTARGGFSSVSAWRELALIIAAVQLLFSLFSFIGISAKDKPEFYKFKNRNEDKEEQLSIKDYASLFKNNEALKSLVVAASTNKIAATSIGSLGTLFYFYVAGDAMIQSRVTPITLIGTVGAVVIFAIYTNAVGRKKSFYNASMAALILSIVSVVLVSINPSSLPILMLIMVLKSFFDGGANLNIIPMIADAADYENYKTGRFMPGMIGTAFSFIDKVVSSFGTVLSGWMLVVLGFESIDKTPPTTGLFWGVLLFYFLIPGIGHLFSVLAFRKYPISKEFNEEMTLELNKRREVAQS